MTRLLITWCVWFGFCDVPEPEPAQLQVTSHSHEDASESKKAPAPPPDTTYRGMGSDWEQWRPLVAGYFPADQVDTAVCVIQHESGGKDNCHPNSDGVDLLGSQLLAFFK